MDESSSIFDQYRPIRQRFGKMGLLRAIRLLVFLMSRKKPSFSTYKVITKSAAIAAASTAEIISRFRLPMRSAIRENSGCTR